MCGRFTLTTPDELLAEVFGLEKAPALGGARYNIAPSEPVASVVLEKGRRRLRALRWGLLAPGEAERDDALVINARSESVATKPLFRESFLARRCLIPADGFYEWRRAGKRREPFHLRLRGMQPFAFAGLWREEEAAADEPAAPACVILTTGPNALMAGIHDRMPVILTRPSFDAWLVGGEASALQALLVPYPAAEMELVQVGPFVNRAGAEGPRCLEPERQKNLFD